MADRVDMSLDDIIKMNKVNKKPQFNRGGNRQPIRTANNNFRQERRANPYSRPTQQQNGGNRGQWKHDMFDGNRGQARLMISNLHFRVSDNDIKDLFKEFGQIKKLAVHYDKSGRSLGNAEVVFMNKSSAVKAIKKYNDVLLDGRKMKITLVEDKPLAISAQPPPSRFQQQQRRPMNGTNRNGLNGYREGFNNRNSNRTGNRTGNRPQQNRAPAPSKEQLDAELDAYVSKN